MSYYTQYLDQRRGAKVSAYVYISIVITIKCLHINRSPWVKPQDALGQRDEVFLKPSP